MNSKVEEELLKFIRWYEPDRSDVEVLAEYRRATEKDTLNDGVIRRSQ